MPGLYLAYIQGTAITSWATAPSMLTDTDKTAAWFDYTDSDTLTEVTGVSQWDDKSGSNNHLKQTTGSEQPIKTLSGITFDGVSQKMKCDAFTLNQPEFIYIVVKNNLALTGATQRYLFDGNTSNDGLISALAPGPVRQVKAHAGGGWSDPNNGLVFEQYGIIRVLFNGANSKLIVNDNTPVTGDFGAVNMSGFTLGSRGDLNFPADMEVAEIVILKVDPSAAEEAEIYDYLNTKYFSWIDMTDSATISYGGRGAALYDTTVLSGVAGSKPVVVDYGDGSREYLSTDGSEHTLTHDTPAAATYTVTFGNASSMKGYKNYEIANDAFYGNVSGFAGASNLELFAVGNKSGNHSWTGDVINLNSGLKYLYLGLNNDIEGDASRFTELIALDMAAHVTNLSTISGDASKCTKLQWFYPWGLNTIDGDLSGITSLENVYVGGYCDVVIDVTNLVNLCSIEKAGFISLGCPALFKGSIAGLTKIGTEKTNPITGEVRPGWLCCADPNEMTGSVEALVDAVYLSSTGTNTISGSITGLTKLQFIGLGGNSTITGSIAGLPDLEVLTNGTVDKPSTVINNTKLILFSPAGMEFTETEVNQILADFWANKDAARPELTYHGRVISLSGAAPTGQGLTDKAALQAYRSPNNDAGEPLWTVTTA